MKLRLLLTWMLCLPFVLLAEEEQSLDYFRELSPKDCENIEFMITTLSSHSSFGLLFYKDDLERVGQKTERVHPLRFINYVFSDENLAACTKEIGRIPWSRFVKRFSERLDRIAEQGLIRAKDIQHFAETLQLNLEDVERLAQEGAWETLIYDLRNN